VVQSWFQDFDLGVDFQQSPWVQFNAVKVTSLVIYCPFAHQFFRID
jgi:hypothetical protein